MGDWAKIIGSLISAAGACYLAVITLPAPKSHFATDGCSMWPNGNYGDCCIAHDRDYWDGGTAEDRLASDQRLRQCVAGRAGKPMATFMFYGVRVGGHPALPFPWRWDFGESYLKNIKEY